MCLSVNLKKTGESWTVTIDTEPTRGPRKAFELDRSMLQLVPTKDATCVPSVCSFRHD
jgi:hypothetical protein